MKVFLSVCIVVWALGAGIVLAENDPWRVVGLFGALVYALIGISESE